MIQLTQCKVPYQNDTREALRKRAAEILHISEADIKNLSVVRRSLDARKKPSVYISYTLRLQVEKEERVLRKNRHNSNLSRVSDKPTAVEQGLRRAGGTEQERIVIVGAGPAGLFCGYYLCLCGFHPVIIERGASIEERTEDVERFWREGVLNPNSNVSFGEGGAGTFSDGKLNTGVKDRTGSKKFILESFERFGAGEEILYDAKPHIGTDVLRTVIVNMRKEMTACGCRVFFHTVMTGIDCENGAVKGIVAERTNRDGSRENLSFPCDRMILAIGHSARDTFAMLDEMGIAMCPKPFAIGVRVQHRQQDIDRMQYGVLDERLPAASYKCTGKASDMRGVYSFCMCPGGYVVNASSEQEGLTVNGMSDVGRDSGYANSAIVVTVNPEDFDGQDSLAGVRFQQKWERLAYDMGGGRIPVQRYEDFKNNRITEKEGKVVPCVKGAWFFGNLRKALPNFLIDDMIDGMEQFDSKMPGFAHGDTLLLGIETRTSSPVRIERDDDLVSRTIKGLYPCGEGAGYAGGIMSAAMDGVRIAMRIQDDVLEGGNHA